MACLSRSTISLVRRAISALGSTASTRPSSNTSLPSNGIATAATGRTAGLGSMRSRPASVCATPPELAISARSESPANNTTLRLGETCRSPRTLRTLSTNACTRANSVTAASSRSLASITGQGAVAQSALGRSTMPSTSPHFNACTLTHSVSVTNGHTGCNMRKIASSVAARTACCSGLLRIVGLMPSRYQSQKSRQTKS